MNIVGKTSQKASRGSLKASASLLGLAAGAVGWSELAAAENHQLQTLILPDHYQRLSDDSLVVSNIQGEQFNLGPEQYMRLEGGLILVVDDLAAGVLHQLDFVGALQTHLISDAFPVRSSDGTIIGSRASSLLRSGEGTTPSLFEEVNIQRYELAQDLSDSAPTMDSVAAAAGVGLCAAGGFFLVMSLAGSDTSETETDETGAAPGAGSTTGTLHPYAGLTLKVDLLHPGADLHSSGKTHPQHMHALDGKLYFEGYDGSEDGLYVYDPGAGTTTKVASVDTLPYDLHALDGKLYFSGYDGSERELYVYEPGSTLGSGTTTKVASADVSGVGFDTSPNHMHALDGKLYFEGKDGSEYELYVYEPGSTLGSGTTTKVASADLRDGGGTYPDYLEALDGKLYFLKDLEELYVYFPDDLTV